MPFINNVVYYAIWNVFTFFRFLHPYYLFFIYWNISNVKNQNHGIIITIDIWVTSQYVGYMCMVMPFNFARTKL